MIPWLQQVRAFWSLISTTKKSNLLELLSHECVCFHNQKVIKSWRGVFFTSVLFQFRAPHQNQKQQGPEILTNSAENFVFISFSLFENKLLSFLRRRSQHLLEIMHMILDFKYKTEETSWRFFIPTLFKSALDHLFSIPQTSKVAETTLLPLLDAVIKLQQLLYLWTRTKERTVKAWGYFMSVTSFRRAI